VIVATRRSSTGRLRSASSSTPLTVWNTRYLKAAAEELARRNHPVREDAWAHLTPLLWQHIHLVGHYRVEEPVITGELRPLRMEETA
jgi:hypothetical protein